MAAFHVRLWPEWRYLPAIARGGPRDAYGFGLFPASYVVGTRTVEIRGEIVHLGWGLRRWPSGEWGAAEAKGPFPKVHSFVAGFGGIDRRVWQNLRVMLKYDTKRANVGARWRPAPHSQLDAGLFGFRKPFGGIAFDVDLL